MNRVVCIPDLLRGTRAFPEGFFDLVREPIAQGCGIHIGHPPPARNQCSLPGFDILHFHGLLGLDSTGDKRVASSWTRSYHSLRNGERAIDYLFSCVPPAALVLSFEMPPWFKSSCNERGVHYLDLRASPLRFGRDLYVAIATSCADLRGRLATQSVSAEELRLEAALLSANVRMHLRRLREFGELPPEEDGSLDESLIFVGQASFDASIVSPHEGRPLRADDFAEKLRTLADGRRVLHKAHPYAVEFGREERVALSKLLGRQVHEVHANAYQILSTLDSLEFVGISSGLLQEAPWFDKQAHILFRPFVPLSQDPGSNYVGELYQQVRFQDLIAPGFWHKLLTPESPAPRLPALPPLPHHHARETLDQWWDYEKVLTWRRSLPHAAFERLGGGLLRGRIEQLQGELRELRDGLRTNRP